MDGSRKGISWMGGSLGLGVAIGIALGAALGNYGLGLGLGILIGLVAFRVIDVDSGPAAEPLDEENK